ncbi:sensor domain-containing protein [Frigoribacterium sp. CFBP 13712]|uniref:sensor histidine kinase n=1 Tax=Frigoribacterium sp. CFBP 13712 TaxID=2775309 RepID=UPI001782D432|nr:sensor domain-containing protein [Frigoribacterium sp. CFBP 13712]
MPAPDRSPAVAYLQRWRALPRETGYLLPLLPLVIVGSLLIWAGLATGVGLAILWIGVPLLAATLLLARRLGGWELRRLAAAGVPTVAAPDWAARRVHGRAWRRWLGVIADGRTWSSWLHAALVQLLLGALTWTIGVVWIGVAIGGPTYWAWGQLLPHGDGELWLHTVVLSLIPGYAPALTRHGLFAGESAFYATVGALFLLTLPIVIHILVLAHAGTARLMLGESRTDILRRDATAAEASRVSAIVAEDGLLRRLERDLHDGPQQSLLRIQFDLASTLRALNPEDTRLRHLLESSLTLSKATLQELRDLSQGLAPPLLQDRGLESALRTLAARSAVPVTTDLRIDAEHPAVAEVERSVYYVVSELLANIAKHSGAATASVQVRTVRSSRTAHLTVKVVDDGHGGAETVAGHGLAGIRERIDGLRGTMTVTSPVGGPTVVTVALPLRAVTGREHS